MGLDWVLDRNRPRKGKEKQFKKRLAHLRALQEGGAAERELAVAQESLDEVSHNPFEDIGAPRVGIDARATKWFFQRVYPQQLEAAKARGEAPPSKEAALKEVHGQYVVELARAQAGVAGGSFLVSSLDYGAGIIDHCTDVVSDTSEAWHDHTAKEAGALARRLEADLKRARSPAEQAKERLTANAKTQRLGKAIAASGDLTFRPWVRQGYRAALAYEDQVNAVKALIQWLEFWSKRGYGFHAWS